MNQYQPFVQHSWRRVPSEIDVRECLPYVGSTIDPDVRQATHRRGSPFADFVEITIVTWYADKRSALDAERAAIETESPVFNDALRPAAVTEWLQGQYLSRNQARRTGSVL
jgi:hypothetical protein